MVINTKQMPEKRLFVVKTRHLWTLFRHFWGDAPKQPKRRKIGKFIFWTEWNIFG